MECYLRANGIKNWESSGNVQQKWEKKLTDPCQRTRCGTKEALVLKLYLHQVPVRNFRQFLHYTFHAGPKERLETDVVLQHERCFVTFVDDLRTSKTNGLNDFCDICMSTLHLTSFQMWKWLRKQPISPFVIGLELIFLNQYFI